MSLMPNAQQQSKKEEGQKNISVKRITIWNIVVEDVDPVLELQPVEKI